MTRFNFVMRNRKTNHQTNTFSTSRMKSVCVQARQLTRLSWTSYLTWLVNIHTLCLTVPQITQPEKLSKET